MTIPGRGDLSPRRRPRRRGRRVLVLLVVATLAVGGWFGWQAIRGDDTASVRTTPRTCVQPSRPPAPAAPSTVHVRVLNGTSRAGLAHDVARALRGRGFRIAGVGNSPKPAAQTTLTHPASDLAQSLALAEQLSPVAVQAGDVRVVTLVLGRDFHQLAGRRQAKRARALDERRAAPHPSPCPSSSS